MKCIACEKNFNTDELFCIASLRGATSICETEKCPTLCNKCSRIIYRTLKKIHGF